MPYFKTIDGCSLYFEMLGEGPGKPTVTFVNGTLQTTIYWKIAARELAHAFRILLYDTRGQGASELGDQPLCLNLHAADLKALLLENGVHRTAMIGLSHGARVALALADQSPDLISRMVLCSLSTRATYRARMIVRSWHEILQRHSLDAMVWAALPHVFGGAYLRENEKHLERIVRTIVRRNKTEALRAHLAALQHYPPLSGMLQKPALSRAGAHRRGRSPGDPRRGRRDRRDLRRPARGAQGPGSLHVRRSPANLHQADQRLSGGLGWQ
jgi:3-oxoadipate enol-lactonase